MSTVKQIWDSSFKKGKLVPSFTRNMRVWTTSFLHILHPSQNSMTVQQQTGEIWSQLEAYNS